MGEAGTDVLRGGFGNDTLWGGGDNDTLQGGADADQLDGGEGDDRLEGGDGDDVLSGGDGDDLLRGGAGADQLHGDDGSDTATYRTATSGLIADLGTAANNTGDAAGDSYDGVENLIGSDHADTLRGNDGDNVLTGGLGADTLEGGQGNDTASYEGAAGGVTADLLVSANRAGEAVGDSFNSIENLRGSSHADVLGGNADNNILDGAGGADTMAGRLGDDRYLVDDVDDIVTEAGNEGTDLVTASVDYTLSANVENLTLGGAALAATGNDLANVLTGNANANVLDGGSGNDTLAGGAGNDAIDGGADSDRRSMPATVPTTPSPAVGQPDRRRRSCGPRRQRIP